MGFLGLMYADALAASYKTGDQTLTLYAKVNLGLRPQFVRDQSFVGGLLFDLEGWSLVPGSESESKDEEYVSFTQEIPFPNIKIASPSNTVVIRTLNYPKGKVVDIHWFGWGEDGDPEVVPVKDLKDADPPAPAVTFPPVIRVSVLAGTTFEIQERAISDPGSFLVPDFDTKALVMENALLRDGNIVWQLNSLQIGLTQFVITGYGGKAAGTWHQVIWVDIYGLKN